MASSSTLLRLFFAAAAASSVSADLFIVGGAFGWELPAANEPQLYTVWALRRQFYVGDTLRFRYRAIDSVVITYQWAFYRCDKSKAIAVFEGGDSLINLDKAGTMYFITGDFNRCKQGMRMTVEVNNIDQEDTNSSMAPPPSIPNATAPVPSRVLSLAHSLSDSTLSFAVSIFVIALIVFKYNL